MQQTSDYERIQVGDELEEGEYVITEEKLQVYREGVGFGEALYPHICLKDYSFVLRALYGRVPVISAKHADEYFNPPTAGKRMKVKSRVADKYVRRDREWVVVETTTTDEDGKLIVKSQHSFLLGGVGRR